MILRAFQLLALCFLIAVAALHVVQNGLVSLDGVFDAYWREVFFALTACATAWLFLITRILRPVVAIFAAGAFFVIAVMDEPSPDAFMTALDGLTDTVLEGIDDFRS